VVVAVMIPDSRLERIEEKLDKLSDTVSDLARIEERMLSVFKRLDRHEKRLDDQEDDLKDLSNSVLLNSKTSSSIERLFWVIITATASVVVYMFK
jgi:50S ribosomal subunit-associated GTPase HflX